MIGKPLRGVTGLHPISLDIEVAPIEASNTQPNTAPPVPASDWNKVLEMKFNNNFNDSTGRHSPVSYGAVISTAQSVEGGSSMYANRDGSVFTDGDNGSHPDFDFTGKDFKIICWIRPTSSGNTYDYVWSKNTSNSIGVTLRMEISGPIPVVYLWPMDGPQVSTTVPDLLSGKWTKIEVNRIGGVWSLLIDDVVASSANTDVAYWVGDWEDGTEFLGFIIGGVANNNGYSGYIDNFVVYTK